MIKNPELLKDFLLNLGVVSSYSDFNRKVKQDGIKVLCGQIGEDRKIYYKWVPVKNKEYKPMSDDVYMIGKRYFYRADFKRQRWYQFWIPRMKMKLENVYGQFSIRNVVPECKMVEPFPQAIY